MFCLLISKVALQGLCFYERSEITATTITLQILLIKKVVNLLTVWQYTYISDML